MTIEDILKFKKEFETNHGRLPTEREIRGEESRRKQVVKKYANNHMYTDVAPYEVIRKISDITVEVRAMDYTQVKFPKDAHNGGFACYYADNRSGQDYEYSSNDENQIIRIRWSKARHRWQDSDGRRFVMSDEPYRFYDYNF